MTVILLAEIRPARSAIRDEVFLQDEALRISLSSNLAGARYRRLALNRDGIVYSLTDRGTARLFGQVLALDQSFRPLAHKRPLDLVEHQGRLYYLLDDRLLCNDDAGKYAVDLPKGVYRQAALAEDGSALLEGPQAMALIAGGKLRPLAHPDSSSPGRVYSWKSAFYFMTDQAIYRWLESEWKQLRAGGGLTALTFRGEEILVGTTNGYFGIDGNSGRETLSWQRRLPATSITCLQSAPEGLWVGTTQGAFLQRTEGSIDYYASRRWLRDDHVLDLRVDGNRVYVLTASGLNQIHFRPMTLAQKAAEYERKIRQRHIRYGFCAELRLHQPGDITTAEMIDTDNDGTWSNYYMASQAFRYAVTGQPEAHRHAWETFDALERLESIHPLQGFPARTFERVGFKFSDPERWHPAPDPHWEWKSHTSSDEIIAHTFGCAVLYETAAQNQAEKQRIAVFFDKIMDHILRHDLYLIDVDGQPTLWARWNPEYVNAIPPTVFDRRLNSAEIIAALQLAFHLTGKEAYRQKALALLEEDGYLENIARDLRLLKKNDSFRHQGILLGDEWNHSDDLLAFDAYWVLHRYALTDELRARFAAAIRQHWEMEQVERCPLWNFVFAATAGNAAECDAPSAVTTLRRFPLDLITWQIRNSHRADLTLLPGNFRHQQSLQWLPPSERRVMRWNGNPFILDGGDGGYGELAGDEFLLPYWMGRYLRIIE